LETAFRYAVIHLRYPVIHLRYSVIPNSFRDLLFRDAETVTLNLFQGQHDTKPRDLCEMLNQVQHDIILLYRNR